MFIYKHVLDCNSVLMEIYINKNIFFFFFKLSINYLVVSRRLLNQFEPLCVEDLKKIEQKRRAYFLSKINKFVNRNKPLRTSE